MSGLFNKGREVGCESGLRRMAVTCTAAIVAVCAATGAAPTNAHAETGSAAVAWGFNQRWQLGAGYGTTRGEDTPVPVVGLSNVTALAASEKFTLALLSDGTVRSWGGNNIEGQLGDGVRQRKEIVNGHFVTVSGLSKVKAISASALHAMALLKDGTLRVWGANEAGTLGKGLVNQRERYNKKSERYETK